MHKFNNRVFEDLLKDLVSDAFYAENVSIRMRISTIRQYSEVVIRRILDFSNKEFVTVGDKNIRKQIIKKTDDNSILIKALDIMQKYGNDHTHTQKVDSPTLEDLDLVIEALFDLYAYLFIEYFTKYSFGSNVKILSSFSILPPIIRYKTLAYLYEKNPQDIIIIDKLVLSILKSKDKGSALDWVEDHKKELESLNIYTDEMEFKNKTEEGLFYKIVESLPDNMYILCINKIELVSNIIEKKGKAYTNFEDAIDLYNEKGIIEEDSDEVIEFNSIMEFCYMGRKSNDYNEVDWWNYIILEL